MTEGVVIDQRFRLGRVIRESSVALVYEAKHRNGADAWIKLPRAREHAAALAAEAQVANALGKNAINIRDDGVTETGLPYLVLEPVTGQRLDHWREHCGGRAPADEAMGLGDELCEAIGAMHRGGFSVGVLRADAIIVVPKGGICLLELEHTRPATNDSVKEDVAAVGRVLYEMLSGTPYRPGMAPLHGVAQELPIAMTSTVDDAARGRFTTIQELRDALRSSIPQWLGPARRPMPSISPDVAAPLDFSEIVLPRSSKILFDPGLLVDSSRPSNLGNAPVPSPSSSAELWGQSGGRSSTTAFEAPPIATVSGMDSGPRSRRGSQMFIILGAASGGALVIGALAALALVFVLHKGGGDREQPPPPAAKAASIAVTSSAASTPSPSPAVAAIAPARDAGGAATKSGETTFRFEGSLSPRLVFVDGAIVGTTKKPPHPTCGTHSVKIGAKGIARSLDLPCDEDQVLVIEANGLWHPR